MQTLLHQDILSGKQATAYILNKTSII